MSQLSGRSVLQLHVTAQLYLENKRKIHILEAWMHADQKGKKREWERVTQRESVRERRGGERELHRDSKRESETERGRERQKEEREREGGRERGWEEEGEYARICVRKPWTSGSSFYVFSSPWASPLWRGLARAAVCSTWGPHSSSWTFLCSIFVGCSLLCLLATTILDSFFLF